MRLSSNGNKRDEGGEVEFNLLGFKVFWNVGKEKRKQTAVLIEYTIITAKRIIVSMSQK